MKLVLSDGEIREILKNEAQKDFPNLDVKVQLSCKDKSFQATVELKKPKEIKPDDIVSPEEQ